MVFACMRGIGLYVYSPPRNRNLEPHARSIYTNLDIDDHRRNPTCSSHHSTAANISMRDSL